RPVGEPAWLHEQVSAGAPRAAGRYSVLGRRDNRDRKDMVSLFSSMITACYRSFLRLLRQSLRRFTNTGTIGPAESWSPPRHRASALRVWCLRGFSPLPLAFGASPSTIFKAYCSRIALARHRANGQFWSLSLSR